MNTFGRNFTFTSFGESHGEAVGGVIDGVPARFKIDFESIRHDLERRAGKHTILPHSARADHEIDEIDWLSGIQDGMTLGTPIAFLIRNTNQRPQDYEHLKEVFREGHADWVYEQKYGIRDYRGGGRASARETVARVVAGAIALWLQANPTLTTEQIKDVFAHTCTHPEENLDYPNNIYGHGQIDVYKGLLYILDLPNSIPELSQQQPAEARFSLQDRRLSVHLTDAAPLSHSPDSLAIYTTDGRMVRSMLLDSDMSADLSSLPTGLYAVQLTTSHQQTTGSTLIRLK